MGAHEYSSVCSMGRITFGEFSDVELNALLLGVLAFVIILGVVIAVIGGVILMNFENLVK